MIDFETAVAKTVGLGEKEKKLIQEINEGFPGMSTPDKFQMLLIMRNVDLKFVCGKPKNKAKREQK